MSDLMQRTIEAIIDAAMKTAEYKYCNQTPEFSLKIENPPYMALTIERLIAPDHGPRPVVSVCHYYEQNGDLMRDPEMVFDMETWEPLYYRQDGIGREQYVYQPPNERRAYRPRLRVELRTFAQTWARNLREQGFIDAGALHLMAELSAFAKAQHNAPDAHLDDVGQ